ncbi:hypothetical protein GW17_00061170 [Ensete ventricosum]|nr:hypothetical protein GW17_00061170 [Ensete ventricosum]
MTRCPQSDACRWIVRGIDCLAFVLDGTDWSKASRPLSVRRTGCTVMRDEPTDPTATRLARSSETAQLGPISQACVLKEIHVLDSERVESLGFVKLG